uniref:CUB domain-containing protein n=1 Tax=Catagonus wagneri TaxID=51154 RepID=A0A8C3YHT2_9CETA
MRTLRDGTAPWGPGAALGAWNPFFYLGYSSCGGIVRGEYRVITTYYGEKTKCVWTIKVDLEFQVAVKIQDLHLTCGKENVEVLDGPPGSYSYGKICKGLDLDYRSSSNTMTVKYNRVSSHPASSYEIVFFQDPQGRYDGAGCQLMCLPCPCRAVCAELGMWLFHDVEISLTIPGWGGVCDQ